MLEVVDHKACEGSIVLSFRPAAPAGTSFGTERSPDLCQLVAIFVGLDGIHTPKIESSNHETLFQQALHNGEDNRVIITPPKRRVRMCNDRTSSGKSVLRSIRQDGVKVNRVVYAAIQRSVIGERGKGKRIGGFHEVLRETRPGHLMSPWTAISFLWMCAVH